MSALHHRPGERMDLKHYLLSEVSVLMLAPRRVGKTWLMERVDDDLTREGHLCVRFDASGKGTEQAFLGALCNAIEKQKDLHQAVFDHLKQRLRQVAGGDVKDSLSQIVGQVDPKTFSECLIESLGRSGRKTVIMVDEFSLFALALASKDPDATRTLLYHLRSLQQSHRNVTWLLAGSVGLDVVARRFGLGGALLDLQPFGLAPFTEAEARSYLTHLADSGQLTRRLAIDDPVFEHLARELGWLAPYYLQRLGRELRPTVPHDGTGRATVTVADVDAAFAKLLEPSHRLCFSAWEEHIDKNFPDEDTRRLEVILNTCCQGPDGETEDTLLAVLARQGPGVERRALKDLTSSLANDGYLSKAEGRWRFRSGLLRRYWLEYMSA